MYIDAHFWGHEQRSHTTTKPEKHGGDSEVERCWWLLMFLVFSFSLFSFFSVCLITSCRWFLFFFSSIFLPPNFRLYYTEFCMFIMQSFPTDNIHMGEEVLVCVGTMDGGREERRPGIKEWEAIFCDRLGDVLILEWRRWPLLLFSVLLLSSGKLACILNVREDWKMPSFQS